MSNSILRCGTCGALCPMCNNGTFSCRMIKKEFTHNGNTKEFEIQACVCDNCNQKLYDPFSPSYIELKEWIKKINKKI